MQNDLIYNKLIFRKEYACYKKGKITTKDGNSMYCSSHFYFNGEIEE